MPTRRQNRSGARDGLISTELQAALLAEAHQLASVGDPVECVKAVKDFFAQLDAELQQFADVRFDAVSQLRAEGMSYDRIAVVSTRAAPGLLEFQIRQRWKPDAHQRFEAPRRNDGWETQVESRVSANDANVLPQVLHQPGGGALQVVARLRVHCESLYKQFPLTSRGVPEVLVAEHNRTPDLLGLRDDDVCRRVANMAVAIDALERLSLEVDRRRRIRPGVDHDTVTFVVTSSHHAT